MRNLIQNKKLLILIISLIITVLTTGIIGGIVIVNANDPLNKYARAEQRWLSGSDKTAEDNISIDIRVLGSYLTLDLNLAISGVREYKDDSFKYDYSAILALTTYTMEILNINIIVEGDTDGYDITIVGQGGMLNLEETKLYLSAQDMRNYVDYDFHSQMIYESGNIELDKEGKFSINGADSVNFILYQIAPIVSNIINMDFLPYLESWLSFDEVQGQIEYSGKDFNKITTSQSANLALPWADLDYIAYNTDNFPIEVINLLKDKKIAIPGVPVVGTLNLNLGALFPDAISVSFEINIESVYSLR